MPPPPNSLKLRLKLPGFTLAELLISLAILGIIATFTIPKILTTQQNASSNAKAKEVAAMIAGAYQQAQLAGTATTATKSPDLTPYMNYLAIDTSGALIDYIPGSGSLTCSAIAPCLKLHNGGTLYLYEASFGGSTSNNHIQFMFDPDGVYSGSSADSAGKTVEFDLFYNGFLTTRSTIKANAYNSYGGPQNPAPNPSWFSW